jgi:spore coat protein A
MKKLLFSRGCALAAVGLMFVGKISAQHHGGGGNGIPPLPIICSNITSLTPFLDPLPTPPTAVPARTNSSYCVPAAPAMCYSNVPEYDMPMTSFMHSFHKDLPAVEVWGYAGSYPGPTFDVAMDSPIVVNWINNLPANYPAWLPADINLHGVPDQSVRTVVHLHGGATLPRYDGYPENWFRTGGSDQYFYGNHDFTGDGQTMWYHDHAVGVTGNNVYAGLAGFYLLRNPALEAQLKLPSGKYEIPLVFQDRDIQTNCPPATMTSGVLPWHALSVVNGKITPYLEVEPRKYRFRVLNGATFRTYGLSLLITDLNGEAIPNGGSVPDFNMVGTDDGYLAKPVPVKGTNMVPLMPGERADFIIDFGDYTNKIITMTNLIDKGNVPGPPFITKLMQFRVTLPLDTADGSYTNPIPAVLVSNLEAVTNMIRKAVVTRDVTLDVVSETPFPGPPFIPGSTHPSDLVNMKFFHDAVSEFPHAGDTEIWNVINLSDEPHPFHIHLTDFRVIDRIRFGGWNTNSDLAFPPSMVTNYIQDRIAGTLKDISWYLSTNKSDTFAARQFEDGPKDTMRSAPFSVSRLVIRWPTNSEYYTTLGKSDQDTNSAGLYVYHCHILNHEDNDMMRPLQLVAPFQPSLQLLTNALLNPLGFNHFKIGIQTRNNESYRLESTSGLSPIDWQPLDLPDAIGTGAVEEVFPPTAVDPALIYRARRVEAE